MKQEAHHPVLVLKGQAVFGCAPEVSPRFRYHGSAVRDSGELFLSIYFCCRRAHTADDGARKSDQNKESNPAASDEIPIQVTPSREYSTQRRTGGGFCSKKASPTGRE